LAEERSVSVVIPVYRAEGTLRELVRRLGTTLTAENFWFEVILVNDGSPDRSWELICELMAEFDWIRGINLMRNYGQHNATLCGVRSARGSLIVTMDDDLQHPPEEIPLLLAHLDDQYDVVYGVPMKRPHSWWRNAFSVFTKYALSKVMGIGTLRDVGAFRAFRSSLRRAFDEYRNPNVYLDVLLSWGTNRFTTAAVHLDARTVGRSDYDFAKLAQMALTILTSYSTGPLRFASFLGFFFTLFGVGVFLYVVITYFIYGSVPGFPFLASLISLFSGIQLFALGLIGEYLARIFDRSIDRPTYVIADEMENPRSR
jgi:glycosyltransferase involved in cell wall biosynthesis